MDVARLNFSHGTHEQHAETAQRVREAAGRAGRPVALLQDLPGPKLRVGVAAGGPRRAQPRERRHVLRRGRRRARRRDADVGLLAGLADAIEPGEVLYLADGSVRLRATAVRAGRVRGRRPRRGRRRRRLAPGAEHPGPGRRPPRGARGGPRAPARRTAHRRRHGRAELRAPPRGRPLRARAHARAADREDREAAGGASNAEEILRASDCVMVARGDLGIELPIEEVPIVQKKLLALAGWMARPSITATQMLDSMVTSSRPTRAEVADVANAILDGTDAVMLSQETAVGAYPVGAIEMMAAVAVHDRADRALRALERAARAARRRDPAYTSRPQRLRGRARAAPRRARGPDALGPLGAARLGPPPAGPDLRALARPRDGAPLRPHVGRARRVDAPPRGHRGADRRRRATASSSSAGASPASASASPRACPAAAGDDEPVPGPDL